MQHVVIYREPGRYAGWPANYGIWCWPLPSREGAPPSGAAEIVLGFVVGEGDPAGGFHTRRRDRPFTTMQARSLDGGMTWSVEPTPCAAPGGRALSADEHMQSHLHIGPLMEAPGVLQPCPGLDFTAPDFALMCARSGLEAGARSWFYASTDRARSWQGPYPLPDFGLPGIAARTDYVVLGPRECLLFLTAAKRDGQEGRVFCARTADGGRGFQFLSWVTDEPLGYTIMPASARLPDGRLLCAVRCRSDVPREPESAWIDLYLSDDDAASWRYLCRPVPDTGHGGNPPTLTLLADGRLCLTYGYRAAPFGIRARLSSDLGASWGEDVILRADGGNHDLGYPRTVQRPDGMMLAAYYFNDTADGDRYIAATLWEPWPTVPHTEGSRPR